MSTNLDTRNVTVGEATPAEPRTEAQIAADLERQRAELAATIDQLYARVQPAALAQEAKDVATARFASLKESASLTRSSRRSRREARRAAREAAAQTLQALKSDVTEAL